MLLPLPASSQNSTKMKNHSSLLYSVRMGVSCRRPTCTTWLTWAGRCWSTWPRPGTTVPTRPIRTIRSVSLNLGQKLYQTLKKCKLLSEEIRNSTEYTFIFETILLFISFNKNLHMDYRFHCSILNCLAEVGWKVDILNLFGRNYSSPSSELVLAGEGDPWAGCAVPGLPGGPGEDPGHQQELPPGALARTVHQL